jgi:hypothetical protein
MMTTGDLQKRAIARALANGGSGCVTRLRSGLYQVESASRPGTAHRVSVDGAGVYRCSCEAGLVGRPCWHAGAVYVAKVEHSGARVVGPAREAAPLAEALAPANVLPYRQWAA